MSDTVTLYENHAIVGYDHVTNPRQFRTVSWCVTHDAQQSGGNYCWWWVDIKQVDGTTKLDCEFVDKLVEA